MNNFTQLESGIFATQEALDELAKKEKANVLVISDTHGAVDMLTLIMEEFGPKSDALIFTGDGIYDLISVMEKAYQYKSAAKWLPPVIAFVQGNNDPSTVTATFGDGFKVPSKVLLQIGKRKILATHGHNESVSYDLSTLTATAQAYDANTVLFGHTHVPVEFASRVYAVNPGSVGYPRRGSQPSFVKLEIIGPNMVPIFHKIKIDYKVEFTPYFPEPYYG